MARDGDEAEVETAEAILRLATGRPDWRVARTEYGAAGSGYLASRGDRRLVLKFAALPPGLERLAQLGVTPSFVGRGEFQGRPWVLQEYVAGDHPSPSWFVGHLPELATVLHRYHDDVPLRSVLAERPTTVHGQDLTLAAVELERARQVLEPISRGVLDAPGAFDRYEGQMRALDAGPEVPVHPDPNRYNFILAQNSVLLVDWTGIRLSNALSDAGPMLWWYVPAAHWPKYLAAYGLEPDQHSLDRIYWETARQSLHVATWLVERGRQESARDFLIDFVAASFQRANPHWRP